MRLAGIREGDVVRCDVRGDRFWALVTEREPGGRVVTIEPLNGRPIPAYHVTARQVVEHYAKRGSK